MNKSLYTLHEQAAKRLRGETVSLVLLIAVFIAILLLTLDNALPAAHGDPFVSSFLGGALCGLLATAAVVTLVKIVELRRALTSDIELRRLHAKENDELARHQEAEVSRLLAHAHLRHLHRHRRRLEPRGDDRGGHTRRCLLSRAHRHPPACQALLPYCRGITVSILTCRATIS